MFAQVRQWQCPEEALRAHVTELLPSYAHCDGTAGNARRPRWNAVGRLVEGIEHVGVRVVIPITYGSPSRFARLAALDELDPAIFASLAQ